MRHDVAPYGPRGTRHHSPEWCDNSVRLTLLRQFELGADGQLVRLASSAQRLLALVALSDGPLSRSRASGTLWPEVDECRASANLRSALWRLGGPASRALVVTRAHLQLAPVVAVDVTRAQTVAQRLVDRVLDAGTEASAALGLLSHDVLPGWDEDWVIVERERFRQLRLHALEHLTERLCDEGRFAEATGAAMAAVDAEPLRESAHRALIGVYIREGNTAQAVRHADEFTLCLRRELGVDGSPLFEDLIAPLRAGSRRARA